MLKVVATMKIDAANLDEVTTLTGQLIDATVQEAGCINYNFCKQNDAEGAYAIIETWESPEVLAAHMQSEHFVALIPKISEKVVDGIDISVFEVLK